MQRWHLAQFLFILFVGLSCKELETNYPSIFIVGESQQGFTSIEDLKNIDLNSHQGVLWKSLISQSQNDLDIPFIDPTTDFPGRDPVHLRHENVSYDLARGVNERLARSAILYLASDDSRFKDLIIRQIEVLFDTAYWPLWCDDAHVHQPPHVDIRTYRLAMWIGLCYNWLYNDLTEAERAMIIEGLDKRAIKPFWGKIAQKPGWYRHRHNWFTNMFGGMGIAAMALGADYYDSKRLLDTIVPQMLDFNNTFGRMGEFNEPPGYAGAIRFSVEFAEAYRYYTGNKRNLLSEKPFPDVCYWIVNHLLPPGRMIAFGDTNPNQTLSDPSIIAAAASANRDSLLQWFYLQNFSELKSPLELFWFNPALQPVSPEGKVPLGIAYKEHGAAVISRSSWDPVEPASVVYGKAGRETNHDDNDVGQLCIDAYGEPVIIDPGKPKPIYPKDYFGPAQYNYYTRSTAGHNILMIGGEEIKSEPNHLARGEYIHTVFDSAIGSAWSMDLSAVYDKAIVVSRRVIHLFEGITAVWDKAIMDERYDVDLHWHFTSKPEWDELGNFGMRGDRVALQGRVISLNQVRIKISGGHHAFKPPYHLTRQGDPLDQRNEPFIKATANGRKISLLTLFATAQKSKSMSRWFYKDDSWQIIIDGKEYLVSFENEVLKISDDRGELSI